MTLLIVGDDIGNKDKVLGLLRRWGPHHGREIASRLVSTSVTLELSSPYWAERVVDLFCEQEKLVNAALLDLLNYHKVRWENDRRYSVVGGVRIEGEKDG